VTPTRRRVLSWGALGVGLALSGCGGDDPPPGLYASRAQVIHQRGDDRLDYPGDLGVRVTVENTSSDRQQGFLETTLERFDRSGGTPAVVDAWSAGRNVELSRGATRSHFFVFEDVFEDGDTVEQFRARATVRGPA